MNIVYLNLKNKVIVQPVIDGKCEIFDASFVFCIIIGGTLYRPNDIISEQFDAVEILAMHQNFEFALVSKNNFQAEHRVFRFTERDLVPVSCCSSAVVDDGGTDDPIKSNSLLITTQNYNYCQSPPKTIQPDFTIYFASTDTFPPLGEPLFVDEALTIPFVSLEGSEVCYQDGFAIRPLATDVNGISVKVQCDKLPK